MYKICSTIDQKMILNLFFVLTLLFISSNVCFANEENELSEAGQLNGQRNVTFENGTSYSGFWTNGLMEGQGVLQLANGDTYR
jgi:hypothetical protein